jgi:transcriptional regulator with XRE-family HTH domain
MYAQLTAKFRSAIPEFPSEPNLDLGLGIKQIRLRMGMTQSELAKDAGMKPAALKTLENGYAKFTTTKNLEALAQALRTPFGDMLLESREWFPGNFFVTKLAEPSQENRKRRRKHREDIWFKQKPLTFGGSQVALITPPFAAPSHFLFMLINIEAGKTLSDLQLPHPNQITGFVQRGSLRIIYNNSREFNLFGNQGFSLRGDKLHHFINQDKDNPLQLCLAFSLIAEEYIRNPETLKNPQSSFSIGHAIKQIRILYSRSAKYPLQFSELSRLTGIDEKALQYLENTTHKDQVIYWDKIEKITQSLKMPFSHFLELAEGKDDGYFYQATAHDRALIDYRHFLGVRIKSSLFPGSQNRFQIAEMYIDPKGGIRRASWQRKDDAKISAYVEDGELLVEVGKNRKTSLREGESVYFDGSLGYIFTNTGNKPAKLLFASYPPIIF